MNALGAMAAIVAIAASPTFAGEVVNEKVEDVAEDGLTPLFNEQARNCILSQYREIMEKGMGDFWYVTVDYAHPAVLFSFIETGVIIVCDNEQRSVVDLNLSQKDSVPY